MFVKIILRFLAEFLAFGGRSSSTRLTSSGSSCGTKTPCCCCCCFRRRTTPSAQKLCGVLEEMTASSSRKNNLLLCHFISRFEVFLSFFFSKFEKVLLVALDKSAFHLPKKPSRHVKKRETSRLIQKLIGRPDKPKFIQNLK